MTVATSELDALVRREHPNPHSVLGAHLENGGVVIRALRPAASSVTVRADGKPAVELKQIHPGGVFEGEIKGAELPLRYQLDIDYGDAGKFTIDDPYAFLPTIGELDQHLIAEGRHEELYDKLGAHVRAIEVPAPHPQPPITGTAFAVWAPSARAVSVVGDFNSWDGRLHAMRSLGSTGIWELFLPGVGPGTNYKYEILTHDHQILLKADPYAFATEVPPKTASVVFEPHHDWSPSDAEWLRTRANESPALERPVSIYEVHLGSWRLNTLEGNRSLTYRELADELSAYVKDMGFTHVELLPGDGASVRGLVGLPGHRLLRPHPVLRRARRLPRVRRPPAPERPRSDPRLGPRPLPARRARSGPLRRHRAVRACRPAPRRASRLGHARLQLRPPRGPQLPDRERAVLARASTTSTASASTRWHRCCTSTTRATRASGFRTSSAAARTSTRSSFLKEFNELAYGREPGVITAAEESTAWPGVSRPTYLGGLGFGFKWNMGWMHDTLGYFEQDPIYRRYHHHELTFSLIYAFSENFILPLSHDEVVHGKGSLYSKMAGTDKWQKLANLRALYAYMCGAPGEEAAVHGQRARARARVELRALA